MPDSPQTPVPDESASGKSAWGEYPNTVLWLPSGQAIDLRERVTAPVLSRLEQAGLARPCGIVTAYNPYGMPVSPAENAARHAALLRTIQETDPDVTPVIVDACNDDQTHCETSVALVQPQDAIIALARQYEQRAIFWFDGNAFWIVPVISTLPAMKLP